MPFADYDAHGLVLGQDYEMVIVAHADGALLTLLADNTQKPNKFQTQVQNLLDRGVKLYVCWNTVLNFIKKGYLSNPQDIMPGVGFVRFGVGAIAAFQSMGFTLVQPWVLPEAEATRKGDNHCR